MAYRGCDLILSCHEAETDHAKWLETRNAGIGGSDAAVIMGLNSYKSPYQLWMEKTGHAHPSANLLLKIAWALDVPPERIMQTKRPTGKSRKVKDSLPPK